MDAEPYFATTHWVLFIGSIICLASAGVVRAGGGSTARQAGLAGFLLATFGVLHFGLGSGRMLPPDISGATFFMIILAGALLVGLLLYATTHPYLRRASQEHILLVQGIWVFVGGGFLMEGVLGVIPAGFSIMDGFMHISSGFLALVAAVACLKQSAFKRQLLWFANIVGVADILIIVASPENSPVFCPVVSTRILTVLYVRFGSQG